MGRGVEPYGGRGDHRRRPRRAAARARHQSRVDANGFHRAPTDRRARPRRNGPHESERRAIDRWTPCRSSGRDRAITTSSTSSASAARASREDCALVERWCLRGAHGFAERGLLYDAPLQRALRRRRRRAAHRANVGRRREHLRFDRPVGDGLAAPFDRRSLSRTRSTGVDALASVAPTRDVPDRADFKYLVLRIAAGVSKASSAGATLVPFSDGSRLGRLGRGVHRSRLRTRGHWAAGGVLVPHRGRGRRIGAGRGCGRAKSRHRAGRRQRSIDRSARWHSLDSRERHLAGGRVGRPLCAATTALRSSRAASPA